MANKQIVCAQCGHGIYGEHIVFDGTTHFCDEECAAAFFDNDKGCVDILLDEGERLVRRD